MKVSMALLADIAGAFATLAQNPAFQGKTDKVAEYAGLVGLAFQQINVSDQERQKLLAQIQAANARGEGLTEDEKKEWRQWHRDAHEAIQAWESHATGPGEAAPAD